MKDQAGQQLDKGSKGFGKGKRGQCEGDEPETDLTRKMQEKLKAAAAAQPQPQQG